MKKKCELCNKSATSYCESDEASLCWACDGDVHRANFLVAKHCRVILCRVCQDPTRWSGSGVQLDPSARVCQACINADDDDDDDVMSDYGDVSSEEDDDDDQVVPTPMCVLTRTTNKS